MISKMSLDDRELKRSQLTQFLLLHLEEIYNREHKSARGAKKFRVGHLLNFVESLLELTPEPIEDAKISSVFSNIVK